MKEEIENNINEKNSKQNQLKNRRNTCKKQNNPGI